MKSIAHRLIMFYGVSPGAGKTTLSDWLRLELAQQNIPTLWIEEHDVSHLAIFKEVVQAFTHGTDDYVQPILQAAAALVQQQTDKPELVITDSSFPCYTWLFSAGVSTEAIADFSQQLAAILAPLNPLVIWLDGDVATLLQRAVAQRGTEWVDDMIGMLNAYNYVPIRPVVGIEEITAFFQAVRRLQTELFSAGSYQLLKLDVTNTPLEVLQAQIMQYLSFQPEEDHRPT